MRRDPVRDAATSTQRGRTGGAARPQGGGSAKADAIERLKERWVAAKLERDYMLSDSIQVELRHLGVYTDESWLREARPSSDQPPQQRRGSTGVVDARLDAWHAARRARDFSTADRIRSELRAVGIEPDGTRPRISAETGLPVYGGSTDSKTVPGSAPPPPRHPAGAGRGSDPADSSDPWLSATRPGVVKTVVRHTERLRGGLSLTRRGRGAGAADGPSRPAALPHALPELLAWRTDVAREEAIARYRLEGRRALLLAAAAAHPGCDRKLRPRCAAAAGSALRGFLLRHHPKGVAYAALIRQLDCEAPPGPCSGRLVPASAAGC
eukprot:TRINITY_DN15236_c0_g1_i1.p1 TRINITY_DN15236_c0_g1~~TRINITY_DN15236_c0_g1_i1.p1  ORF type:complete len:345 (+),score=39.13 TRINITY_DN15236_c0_g1_i1:65-1036(+)